MQNQYMPDHVSPPGETLLEALDMFGVACVELAECIGESIETINGIISGIAPITPAIAMRLERVFGVLAQFWNIREQIYRQYLEREKA